MSLMKSLIPEPIKVGVKKALRDRALRRAMRRLTRLSPGELPEPGILRDLQYGWGNESFSADVDYLLEVARQAVATDGPILECGSGLTTIIMGLLAGRRGVSIWTLEHNADWRGRLIQLLERFHVSGVELCLAPLRDYGGFSWYEVPLERMPKAFRLVICDGPPTSTTPGGRYGLMQVLGPRLAEDVVVLLDDAERPEESAVLERWTKEARVRVRMVDTSLGRFALITKN